EDAAFLGGAERRRGAGGEPLDLGVGEACGAAGLAVGVQLEGAGAVEGVQQDGDLAGAVGQRELVAHGPADALERAGQRGAEQPRVGWARETAVGVDQREGRAGGGALAAGELLVDLHLLGGHLVGGDAGEALGHDGSSVGPGPRNRRGFSTSMRCRSGAVTPRWWSCSATMRRHSGSGGTQRENTSEVSTRWSAPSTSTARATSRTCMCASGCMS